MGVGPNINLAQLDIIQPNISMKMSVSGFDDIVQIFRDEAIWVRIIVYTRYKWYLIDCFENESFIFVYNKKRGGSYSMCRCPVNIDASRALTGCRHVDSI